MILKIFWQKNCPNCPLAKELGKKLEKEIKVELHNVETVDGLAEAAYFNVLSTPTLVLVDDGNREVASWRGKVPKEEEIRKFLNK